jgi:phospholipid/cholesterol/gamma-HCH transport system substrate-binding protein
MAALSDVLRTRAFRLGLVGVVVAAGVFAGVEVTKGPATYPLQAVYSSAPGLFPGAAVDVIGVKVGTVTSVKNVGNQVDVGMVVNQGVHIPARVVASLVAPQLLGQPDIDLNPGYTRGPYLAAGATIPEKRTSVPVSTDQVLKELQRTLNAIDPHAVGDLVSNLASDLNGQGANLNKLIAGAAGTIAVLANKGNDLGRLNGTLAQLTGTLDTDTQQIEQLVRQYDTVSTVIAQHSGQLNDAVGQLAGASSNLVSLLVPNLVPLESDVGTVTTVGRTLDRNLTSVDQILQQGSNLFQGAARAYDPNYNWLDLNLELSPGVTSAYISGLLRDRLAGICRRIVANHAAGLTGTVLTSLNACANPASGFFDPLLSTIPSILNLLNSASGSQTAAHLLQQGLNQILALQPSGGGGNNANPGTPPSSSAAPNKATPTTTPTTPAPTTTTTSTPPASCGLLGALLGCSSNSAATSTTSTNNKALGGLLSQKGASAPATLAVQPAKSVAPAAPSLTAPAAALLGPLPQDASSAASHRAQHRVARSFGRQLLLAWDAL